MSMHGAETKTRKKSALKAGSVAGPRSPQRVSAKHAAIPSAFVADPEWTALYTAFSMREREAVNVRVLIGKLSAAVIEKRDSKIKSYLDKLSQEVVPSTILKDPRAGAKRKALETLKKRYGKEAAPNKPEPNAGTGTPASSAAGAPPAPTATAKPQRSRSRARVRARIRV